MYYRLFNIAKKSVFLWFMLSQIVIAVPVPQLIKDVNTNQAVYRGSNFQIDIKGVLYYLDYKSEGSVELWRYDPSSSTGSVRVAFIKTDSEYEEYPNNFIEMDGVLYFTALYKTRYALWQYDPNASAGLVRVGDVMLIRPSSMTKVGGVLYFSSGGAIDGVGYKGTELWKYDPRSFSGPVLVADIDAGRSDSDPQHLTEIEGVLYFSADNGITGRELWKYDTRSSTGPVLVTDIHAGTGSSAPQNLTEIAGVLYFSADNGITGRELWKYDPSSSVSPVLVGDINVGTGSSAPQNLTEVAGVLYFSATGKTASGEVIGRELWQYDLSSSSSPVLVVDLNAGPDDSRPESLIGIEGVLYFSADDGVTGRELWQYDSSFSTSA